MKKGKEAYYFFDGAVKLEQFLYAIDDRFVKTEESQFLYVSDFGMQRLYLPFDFAREEELISLNDGFRLATKLEELLPKKNLIFRVTFSRPPCSINTRDFVRTVKWLTRKEVMIQGDEVYVRGQDPQPTKISEIKKVLVALFLGAGIDVTIWKLNNRMEQYKSGVVL